MTSEAKERRKPVTQNQVDIVGGKAQNLHILAGLSKEMNFEVPPFQVIPIGADYDEKRLRELFESLQKPLAVRSSSPWEDLEGFSFAGMFASVLGVVDFPSFQRAVQEVLASARASQVTDYARQHGLDPDDGRMAVIVQEMVVEPSYSGVCYSTASTTASTRDRRTIIEFVPGFANDLMSGEQQGNIASFDKDLRLTMEHGSEMPNLRQVAKIARDLEVVFGQRLDIEFAVGKNGRVFIVQARPITDPVWSEVQIPEIEESRILFRTKIVVGSGLFTGEVFVLRSPSEMQRYAQAHNRRPIDMINEQFEKLIEFVNRRDGFCLVTDMLEAHELFMRYMRVDLAKLRALVTVNHASRFSHPTKVVHAAGAFCLGVVGRVELLRTIKIGDTLTVASDGRRGVAYDLKGPEAKSQTTIDLTKIPMIEYKEAMNMQHPPYEEVDGRVFLGESGEVGVRIWDYNEEKGVPTDVFYDLVEVNGKSGTVLAEGEYRSYRVIRRYPDFPSLLESLLAQAESLVVAVGQGCGCSQSNFV